MRWTNTNECEVMQYLDKAVEEGQHVVDLNVRRQALHQHGGRQRGLNVVRRGLRRHWWARVPVDDWLIRSRCGRDRRRLGGSWRSGGGQHWRRCIHRRRQGDRDDGVDRAAGPCRRRQLHLSWYSAHRCWLVRHWCSGGELRRQKGRSTWCTIRKCDAVYDWRSN